MMPSHSAISETGSGKTLAYAAPAMVHIAAQPPSERGDGPSESTVRSQSPSVMLLSAYLLSSQSLSFSLLRENSQLRFFVNVELSLVEVKSSLLALTEVRLYLPLLYCPQMSADLTSLS